MADVRALSGYSVDRRGYYQNAMILDLLHIDPMSRPLCYMPGWFEQEDLKKLIEEEFPDGLSLHGWQYMTQRHDFIQHPKTGDAYVHNSWQTELFFELVRRSFYPAMPSRFQSFYAWESLDEAAGFRTGEQPVYRIEADRCFRADQAWLTLGVQNVAGWLHARRYWEGVPTQSPKWEIVMRAPIRVVQRIC